MENPQTETSSLDQNKEVKHEPRPNRSDATLNKEAYDKMIKFLMTNPKTGERMSYAESRMMYG